jgi:hypothetical protein
LGERDKEKINENKKAPEKKKRRIEERQKTKR